MSPCKPQDELTKSPARDLEETSLGVTLRDIQGYLRIRLRQVSAKRAALDQIERDVIFLLKPTSRPSEADLDRVVQRLIDAEEIV